MNLENEKIFVAGHRGMVGSALVRLLQKRGAQHLLLRGRAELDLKDAKAVNSFFEAERPDHVILVAAKVGGIQANMQDPGTFLFDNLVIQNNVIDESRRSGVKKICFLGSSCIYPRECPQPMKEEYLMTGPLEPTNEGYALAKIAGLRLVQYYAKQYGMNGICPMPCNLYGTNDSFDLKHSHVLSALVRRFCDAVDSGLDEVSMWGTGSAKREFMHVDDVAEAVLFLMEKWDSPEIINVGPGNDVSIRELAETIAEMTGYKGTLAWDTTKPDGMPRKCLDVSRLKSLGYEPKISLREGIGGVIEEYRRLKREGKIK